MCLNYVKTSVAISTAILSKVLFTGFLCLCTLYLVICGFSFSMYYSNRDFITCCKISVIKMWRFYCINKTSVNIAFAMHYNLCKKYGDCLNSSKCP